MIRFCAPAPYRDGQIQELIRVQHTDRLLKTYTSDNLIGCHHQTQQRRSSRISVSTRSLGACCLLIPRFHRLMIMHILPNLAQPTICYREGGSNRPATITTQPRFRPWALHAIIRGPATVCLLANAQYVNHYCFVPLIPTYVVVAIPEILRSSNAPPTRLSGQWR